MKQIKDRVAGGRTEPASLTPQLPDINAETYPFARVQDLLDRAAYLTLYSIPTGSMSVAVRPTYPAESEIGFRIHESLYRFQLNDEAGARANGVVGEELGTFTHRWLLMPSDFIARPGCEPPPTPFQPTSSQRFVMLDSTCTFGDGRDRFRGFGTGRTYPMTVGGKSWVAAAAVGTILSGSGRFSGCEGTYTYCGALTPSCGFQGCILFRFVDPDRRFLASRELPPLRPHHQPEAGVTYIRFRGQKTIQNRQTQYFFGQSGRVEGIRLEPEIMTLHCDAALDPDGGLRTTAFWGSSLGRFSALILLNLLNPDAPGTVAAPNAFRDFDDFTFVDATGAVIGGFAFDGGAGRESGHPATQTGEGRSFNLRLPDAPGQQALRFGGFGPIVSTRGAFQGAEGLLVHNSAVGIAPHAISTSYVVRIHDPDGRYCRAFCRLVHGATRTVTTDNSNDGWGPVPPSRGVVTLTRNVRT